MRPCDFSHNNEKTSKQPMFDKTKDLLTSEADSFWKNCDVFTGSSPEDVSLNHDKYLYEEIKWLRR